MVLIQSQVIVISKHSRCCWIQYCLYLEELFQYYPVCLFAFYADHILKRVHLDVCRVVSRQYLSKEEAVGEISVKVKRSIGLRTASRHGRHCFHVDVGPRVTF